MLHDRDIGRSALLPSPYKERLILARTDQHTASAWLMCGLVFKALTAPDALITFAQA